MPNVTPTPAMPDPIDEALKKYPAPWSFEADLNIYSGGCLMLGRDSGPLVVAAVNLLAALRSGPMVGYGPFHRVGNRVHNKIDNAVFECVGEATAAALAHILNTVHAQV